MHVRAAFVLVLIALSTVAAAAQSSSLAPADEYFGRYRLSILGVSNMIHDAGARIADTGPNPSILAGPLAFATDALHDWERKYPSDTWIPRMLLGLENDYIAFGTPDAMALASKTAAWLVADYPNSPSAAAGQLALGDASASTTVPTREREHAAPWERFAALRAPLASSR